MKIRAVVILVGLAISFAWPIFAQEKEDVKPFPFTPIPAGPQLVQQIEAINQKFDEAFNKHDAAAVGALYTSNAVQTTPQGSFSGREAIEGYIVDLFQRHNPSDRVTKMSYVYAFGGDLCALARGIRNAEGLAFDLGKNELWATVNRRMRFSIHSGTAGADFASMLVLGAQPGLVLGTLFCHCFPSFTMEPTAFAVVGMAAFFTAVVRAPVTAIVLVNEHDGSYDEGSDLVTGWLEDQSQSEWGRPVDVKAANDGSLLISTRSCRCPHCLQRSNKSMERPRAAREPASTANRAGRSRA